jgi:MFS transporter, FSR family, fosmidomycin resistance protein
VLHPGRSTIYSAAPHAKLFWAGILNVVIGFIFASTLSAIFVYSQKLGPRCLDMIFVLFFGFAFGMGGIGAAALGKLADTTSII